MTVGASCWQLPLPGRWLMRASLRQSFQSFVLHTRGQLVWRLAKEMRDFHGNLEDYDFLTSFLTCLRGATAALLLTISSAPQFINEEAPCGKRYLPYYGYSRISPVVRFY